MGHTPKERAASVENKNKVAVTKSTHKKHLRTPAQTLELYHAWITRSIEEAQRVEALPADETAGHANVAIAIMQMCRERTNRLRSDILALMVYEDGK